MYYELYIDVYFAENFMMDYLLLLLVRRLIQNQTKRKNLFLAALAGSVLTCIVTLLPVSVPLIKEILFHVGVNSSMILIGFKPKEIRKYLAALVLLYVCGIMLGGLMTLFSQYIRVGSLFFFLALAGYYFSCFVWDLLTALLERNQYRCRVVICNNGRQVEALGLMDSGNTLRDKVTGKPVCVVTRTVARQLWGEAPVKELRYISYHSIGRTRGVMPLLQADSMGVKGKKKDTINWIAEPLIAVCEEEMFTEEYDMILNLDILIGGANHDDKNCGSTSV